MSHISNIFQQKVTNLDFRKLFLWAQKVGKHNSVALDHTASWKPTVSPQIETHIDIFLSFFNVEVMATPSFGGPWATSFLILEDFRVSENSGSSFFWKNRFQLGYPMIIMKCNKLCQSFRRTLRCLSPYRTHILMLTTKWAFLRVFSANMWIIMLPSMCKVDL